MGFNSGFKGLIVDKDCFQKSATELRVYSVYIASQHATNGNGVVVSLASPIATRISGLITLILWHWTQYFLLAHEEVSSSQHK